MRNKTAHLLIGMSLIITSCANSENPQLAMCQAVTKQLLGDNVSNWDNINQSDSVRLRTIDIAFTQADGAKNTVNCTFPINQKEEVDTAPNRVAINGRRIETKELFIAGAQATKSILAGTAANTVARSKELAQDAKTIAADAAGKAREGAAEASQVASELAGKARESAAGASTLAREIADKAKESAKEASQLATDAAQQARDKALEATDKLQQTLNK